MSKPILRRTGLAGMAALCLMVTGLARAADDAWPSEPVHAIVGYPAGTSPDILARLVSDPLSKALGKPVVIDNKAGAGGNIGVGAAVRAKDGYTMGFTTNGPLTTAPKLVANLPYDPAKDIQPLSLAATSPLVLVVDNNVPAKTLQEFVAWAKTQADGVTYGSVGQGSGSHLTMALFEHRTGIKMVHVPYQGFPAVTNAIIGHVVQSAFMAPSGALVQAKSGNLRILAVSSSQRSPLLPDVPTVAEATGIADFRAELWIAAFAPAAMPTAHAQRLSTEINAALQQPEVREKLAQQGWQAVGGGPEVLRKRISDDTAMWGAVIDKAQIKPQ